MMLALHKIMFLESSLLTAGLVVLSIVAGLVMGSIACTVSLRMSQGRRLLGVTSRCPACDHDLTLREQIPVVGWLLNHGACAYCGAPISLIYPASEILGAGIVASIVLRHGVSIESAELLVLAFSFMIIGLNSVMDYRIPNGCIMVAALARVAYLVAFGVRGGDAASLTITSLVGAAALGIPLLLALWLSNALMAREVTGMGTVKLVAVVGFYLGWQQGLICLAGAFALGALVWIVSPAKLLPVEVEGGARDAADVAEMPSPRDLRATREEDIAEPMRLIPFAPSIVIACWVMVLLGVAPALWNTPVL